MSRMICCLFLVFFIGKLQASVPHSEVQNCIENSQSFFEQRSCAQMCLELSFEEFEVHQCLSYQSQLERKIFEASLNEIREYFLDLLAQNPEVIDHDYVNLKFERLEHYSDYIFDYVTAKCDLLSVNTRSSLMDEEITRWSCQSHEYQDATNFITTTLP